MQSCLDLFQLQAMESGGFGITWPDDSPNTTPIELETFLKEWKEEMVGGHQIENSGGMQV